MIKISNKIKKIVYLDYASLAPVDTKVVKQLDLKKRAFLGNPSAIHKNGIEASNLIKEARKRIASELFAHEDEIIFTGSGTESDAIAILGIVSAYKDNVKPHIITSKIEHAAVLENCKMLEESKQAEVTYIDVDEKGFVDIKEIKNSIKKNTVLVSIMYANNEIGTIQPLTQIAKIIRHYRKENNTKLPLFHSDSCQAMNYLYTENIEKLGVDLLTFNSSKIYGPQGIGVLYKKRGILINPIYKGGGQEFGIRSGTENTMAIAGISYALSLTNKIKEKESARLVKIRDYGIKKILELNKSSGYQIILNGDEVNRLPNNINISVSNISSELLVIELNAKGIEVSSKSACKSDELDESHVITAIRKEGNKISSSVDGSLRISLGRQTKKGDIDIFVKNLKDILIKYRQWK